MELLRKFEAENEDIQGSAVVSIQGLPICSNIGHGDDSEAESGILAAMSAAIISVSERACDETKRGKLKRILLDGEDGIFILQTAGENAILCVLVKNDRNLGIIFMLMQVLAKKIAEILE
ncbi:MAG: roadblock/LC7 domain-containing protein [Promethearchaeota archaeon]